MLETDGKCIWIIDEANLLFRGGGIRIRIISNLIQFIGKAYKQNTISEILECFSSTKNYEIDPDKVASDAELEDNVNNVKTLVIDILAVIQTSLQKLPRLVNGIWKLS